MCVESLRGNWGPRVEEWETEAGQASAANPRPFSQFLHYPPRDPRSLGCAWHLVGLQKMLTVPNLLLPLSWNWVSFISVSSVASWVLDTEWSSIRVCWTDEWLDASIRGEKAPIRPTYLSLRDGRKFHRCSEKNIPNSEIRRKDDCEIFTCQGWGHCRMPMGKDLWH